MIGIYKITNIINDKVYYGTMKTWLQGRCKMRQEFIDKGLHYATQEEIENFKK